MRTIVLFLACIALSVFPAYAQDWGTYDNARFGYRVDFPPGFVGNGEADNGDGQVFTLASGTQELRVWGGNALDGFEAWATGTIETARGDGWTLTNAQSTPSWLSFGGIRNGMIVHTRAIALCGGEQFALFEMVYPEGDLAEIGSILIRLGASLRATGASC